MVNRARKALPVASTGRSTKRLYRRSQRLRRRTRYLRMGWPLLAILFSVLCVIVVVAISQRQWSSAQAPTASIAPTTEISREASSVSPAPLSLGESSDSKLANATIGALAQQIRKLGNWIITTTPKSDFRPLFHGDFRCSPLRPDALVTAYEDENLRVIRAASLQVRGAPSREQLNASSLAETLEVARSGFPKNVAIQFDFQILNVGGTPDAPTATVSYRMSAIEEYRGTQQNGIWLCRWTVSPDSAPQFSEVRLIFFEEITLASKTGQFFSEPSTVLFEKDPSLAAQLLVGEDVWMQRLPRSLGADMFLPHGIALGDVNGDDLDDLYLCQPAGLPNRLLIQAADGTVVDNAEAAGVDFLDDTVSALFVDLDNDGDQDLLLATPTEILGLSNDGAGTFKLRMTKGGLLSARSLSASDFDLDGDLDLFVCGSGPRESRTLDGAGKFPIPFTNADNGGPSQLLQNDGQWAFHDVTQSRGLEPETHRWNSAAAWSDFDRDGDPDLCVSSEFGPPRLYRNDGKRFLFSTLPGGSLASTGQSCHWSDMDNDGRLDLFVAGRSNQPFGGGNCLWRNGPKGFVRDDSSALVRGGWSFGSAAIDLNNDGNDDVVVSSGKFSQERAPLDHWFLQTLAAAAPADVLDLPNRESYYTLWEDFEAKIRTGSSLAAKQQMQAMLNIGAGFTADVSAICAPLAPEDGRALAVVDWDGDGDLDLWARNRTGVQIRLLKNNLETNHHHVQIRLVGRTVNQDAIGAVAQLHLHADSAAPTKPATVLTRELTAGSGFVSQSTKWLHFGLGTGARIEKLVIQWPGGEKQELHGLLQDRRYIVHQGISTIQPQTPRPHALPQAPVGQQTTLPLRTTNPSSHLIAVRIPLPNWSLRDPQGKEMPLRGVIERPTVLVIDNSSNPHLATQIAVARSAFQETGVKLLLLEAGKRTRDNDSQLAVDFVLDPPLIQKLRLLDQAATERSDPKTFPCAFLVSSDHQLVGIYRSMPDVLTWKTDLAAFASDPGELATRSLPFVGRWHRYNIDPGLDRVARLFRAAGFNDDASAFEAADRLWSESSSGRLARSYQDFVTTQLAPLDIQSARRLLAGENTDEVVARFEDLLLVTPQPWAVHNNVGVLWLSVGETDRALLSFEQAIGRKADYAPALANLGQLLFDKGKDGEAVTHYRKALQSDPEVPLPKRRLAWALATSPESAVRDREGALKLAKEICAHASDARALDILAAAYAENANFRDASEQARRALELATQQGDKKLTNAIAHRLGLYRDSKPYRESTNQVADQLLPKPIPPN